MDTPVSVGATGGNMDLPGQTGEPQPAELHRTAPSWSGVFDTGSSLRLDLPRRRWHAPIGNQTVGRVKNCHQNVHQSVSSGNTRIARIPPDTFRQRPNEHFNGRVRCFLFTGTNFDYVTQKKLDEYAGGTNNRQRKVLGFQREPGQGD